MSPTLRPSTLLRTLRWPIFIVAGLLILTLISWLAIPPLTKHIAQQQIEARLGRKAVIGDIRFNPFTLTLTATDVTLYEPDRITPSFSARMLLLDASAATLFRLAPVLEEIRVSSPVLHLVRTGAKGASRTNFSDVLERIHAMPKSDKPAQFSLANIQLDNGAIRFEDKVTGKQIDVAAVKLGIPFLSNFPAAIDAFIQPNLSATINGTRFGLEGRSKPFADSRETTLALDVDRLDLASYAAFSPVELPLKIVRATLSTKLDLNFMLNKNEPEVVLSGAVSLNDVALSDRKSAPLFKAAAIETRISKLNVLTGDAVIDTLKLQAPEVWAALDAGGAINWAALAGAKGPSTARPGEQASAKKPEKRAPQLSLAQFSIKDGTFNWLDTANATPAMALQLKNLNAHASHFSLDKDANPATVSISAGTKDGQQIDFIGQVNPAKAALAGKADVRGMALAQYQPYLNRTLAAGLAGKLSLSTLVKVEDNQVQLHQLGITIDDMKLAAGTGTDGGLVAKRIMLENASVNTGNRTFNAAALKLAGLQGDITRDGDGKLNLQRLLAARPGTSEAARPPAAGDRPEWVASVNRIAVTDSALNFTDRAVSPAVSIKSSGISLSAENLSSKFDRPIRVALQAGLDRSGKLDISGELAPQMKSLVLDIDGRNLPLAMLQPYFTKALNVHVAGGQATARGKLALTLPAAGKPMTTRFTGTARLADFRMLNKDNASDFLKWKTLDFAGIDADLGGARPTVTLGTIALSDFYVRAILSADGKLNLRDIVAANEAVPAAVTASGKTSAVTSPGTTTVAPLPPPAVKENTPVIRVGQIVIKSGNINFTDNFVKPNYTVNMTGMNGTVGAIASDQAQPAAIDLNGKIDNAAPVTISGSLNPLFKPMFLDIKASANGIELPRLTPYATKYAGYPIEKGKLSMDVNYRIEEQSLTARNSLRIDQLTFGEKVDSPTATELPVLLAVSLLKDRNGQINIDLPISGSLSDPAFSVGGIITRVFANMIVKAITSPFALIASAFGGGAGEQLSYAEFAPGSAALTPAAQAKLDTLAKALTERPGLKLDITGRADKEADIDGARLQSLNRKLRMLKQKDSLNQGRETQTDEVALSEAERIRYLEKLYASETFDKPRNVLGLVKTLPPEEMEKLILENTRVSDDDLLRLAGRRATLVRRYLEDKGQVPLERMYLIAPKLSAGSGKNEGQPSRVDFALN